jgi:hypothetical protein
MGRIRPAAFTWVVLKAWNGDADDVVAALESLRVYVD